MNGAMETGFCDLHGIDGLCFEKQAVRIVYVILTREQGMSRVIAACEDLMVTPSLAETSQSRSLAGDGYRPSWAVRCRRACQDVGV